MAKAKALLRKSNDYKDLNNLVIISDTHGGCKVGLCPPQGAALDEGGRYMPSPFQLKVWSWWEEFWYEFVPDATRGEPYGVLLNGDAIDGTHHGSTTQFSHNIEDQTTMMEEVLKPVVTAAEGRYWHVRGTEAHVGKSAVEEERLAKRLGAIPNPEGQHSRYDLWKVLAGGKILIHALHHIGATGSQAYEATAVHKELIEEYAESARWARRPPDAIVRSHRHRGYECKIPCGNDSGESKYAHAVVTPAWQGKTPFVWKIPGGRLATPQFGGVVLRYSDDGEFFVRAKTWTIERSREE